MEAKRSSNPNREEHVMNVLVIGATGNVGSYLTKRLREERVPVRALVRSSDKALTIFPDANDAGRPLEIVSGAFDDPAVLHRAFDGVDAAFLALGTSPRQVALEKGLIDAAARAHLKQLVRQSVLRQNVQATYEIARLHGELDAYVAASGVPHTDLRPAYFTSNLLAAAPSIASSDRWYGTAPTGRIAMCDPRDVGDAAAVVLQAVRAEHHVRPHGPRGADVPRGGRAFHRNSRASDQLRPRRRGNPAQGVCDPRRTRLALRYRPRPRRGDASWRSRADDRRVPEAHGEGAPRPRGRVRSPLRRRPQIIAAPRWHLGAGMPTQ
jgi:uncharacterized protein YbjT (DUF2867 family)